MRLKRSCAFLVCSFLLAAYGVTQDKTGQGTTNLDASATAFLHVNVIAMNTEVVLEDQTVVVNGERIADIGPAKLVKVPRGARLIESHGKYLIPGLVDAHVHLQSEIEFPLYLANGVTSVFNLDGRAAHLLWKKRIASGELLGPAIFSTGPIFLEAHTPAEDVKLVDEQADAGYDAVKIYNGVSKEEYPALINEAKRRNMLLMGHVARGPGFAMTLQYGQSIAHLEEIIYTNFNPQNDDDFDHYVLDESKVPEIVKQTKDANVFVIATLNNFSLIVQQATELDTFLKNPNLRYVAPWTLEQFQPAANRYKNRFPASQYDTLRKMLAMQRKLLKALSDAGVPLMAGTDATEIGPIAGFGLPDELSEFVQDGMSPYQALRTATVNPARYLRQYSQSGTIEIGKRADLVLVAGNPLQDISNVRRIEGTMTQGRWLSSTELHEMVDGVPMRYANEWRSVEAMVQQHPGDACRYLELHDPLARMAGAVFAEVAAEQDIVPILTAMRNTNPNGHLVSEDSVNTLGYSLIGRHLYPQAVAVLTMNTQVFPKSANTWDSLADAESHAGNIPAALKNYQRALEVDPKYMGSDVAKKFIAEHAAN